MILLTIKRQVDFIFYIDAAYRYRSPQTNTVLSRPNTDPLKNTHLKIVAQSSSIKKVFLKVLQNFQEKTCSGVSFLIKLYVCLFPFTIKASPY